MKKKTFAILFYVKKTKLLRNGEAPVFMRITAELLKNRYMGISEVNVSFVELYAEHNKK